MLRINLEEHRKNKSLLRAFEVNYLLHPELFPEKKDLLYLDWHIIGQLFDHYDILEELSESQQREKMKSLLFIIDALTHEYLFNSSNFESDSHFLQTLLEINLV